MPSDDIHGLDVEVFAPCAMGAIVSDHTIPRLKARVIAGAAHNQLAKPRHGEELMSHGILYAPDYVINAGGVIDVFHQRTGFVETNVRAHVGGIHDTLLEIFERTEHEERPTQKGGRRDRRGALPQALSGHAPERRQLSRLRRNVPRWRALTGDAQSGGLPMPIATAAVAAASG